MHVFGLDTWWKKLVLILGVIGVIVLVVAVIGGIISILAPTIVLPLIVLSDSQLVKDSQKVRERKDSLIF